MIRVDTITEAKTQLSALIEKVLEGEEVVIGRYGKPVARLVPFVSEKARRVPGVWKGQVRMSEDFDEYGAELKEMFEGRD